MNSYGGSVTSTLLITLVVLVVIFLVLREFFCWYWKINQSIALLTEIRDLLAGKALPAAASSVGPNVTSTPAAPIASGTAAAAPPAAAPPTGFAASVRSLAERVRDNPRLPVDEKIELLQRLGGKFAWDKGSTCKVIYKGQEQTFPSGREFGDWLSAQVLPEVLQVR